MFKRPYTCIFMGDSGTASCIITAPDGSDRALSAAKEKLPGAKIIAMIPGMHADHLYTYDVPTRVPYVAPPESKTSPWPDNLPPGF